jgi:thioesterase domain-containing protein
MQKEFIENTIAFVQRMGLKVLELQPRYVKLMVPLKSNENHIGSMYAGALFTLAEIPGGALIISTFDVSQYYPVVKEMTLRFRRPAIGDATIEMSLSEEEVSRIRTEASANGKSEFVLSGEIKNAGGETVAESRGIYQLRAMGR